MSDLATLYEVQQVDTRIQELEREREALDSGAELRAQVEALRMQVRAAQDDIRGIENEARDVELQIKTCDGKKRAFEDKMYSGRVHNPKELEDLQREVEMLAGQVDKLEDRGLDLMEEAERRRAALVEQESQLREKEERLATLETDHQAATARIAEETARLAAQREQLTPGLPQDLVRRYDEIRARRANLAIVKVASDATLQSTSICPGCRIAISLDTMRQLKRGERTVLCESCGRILYWEQE